MSTPSASGVYDMRPAATRATRDISLRQAVSSATLSKDAGRDRVCREAFGDRYDEVRALAGRIKRHALDHLDHYLDLFVTRAEACGAVVHFARDGGEANAIAVGIARAHACRTCVKSKSMVTEETGLVAALQEAGVETVETDLGEFILQLDGDTPSHIVTPMIHKDRRAVGRAFERELGVAYTSDPGALAGIARTHLRELYKRADLGISGANFLVAETGAIVVCSNEGNARFCTSAPRVHVVFAGIEKIVADSAHLAVLLKLLARSATAQPLTCYTSVLAGPRRGRDPDGPEQVHIVLLDNGRISLLREESREMLQCIRCGACLNTCPVYRGVGGHAYGSVYSGPIGAILTPSLNGVHRFPDLPGASSLCGACRAACPVNIDIPAHLIRLRARIVRERLDTRPSRTAMRAWAWMLKRPWAYTLASRAAAEISDEFLGSGWAGPRGRQMSVVKTQAGTGRGREGGEAGRMGWGALGAWAKRRDVPLPAAKSFSRLWREGGVTQDAKCTRRRKREAIREGGER